MGSKQEGIFNITARRESIAKRKGPSAPAVSSLEQQGLPQVSRKCRDALIRFVEDMEKKKGNYDASMHVLFSKTIIAPLKKLKESDNSKSAILLAYIELYKIARLEYNRKTATYNNLGINFDPNIDLGPFEDKDIFNFHPV